MADTYNALEVGFEEQCECSLFNTWIYRNHTERYS